jgi:phosphoglycolate phosphatase
MSSRFAGVVFDLDGTLIHSAPDIAASLNIILAECGIATFTIADTYQFIGAGAKHLITQAFAARGHALDDEESTRLTTRYLAAYKAYGSPATTLYPGVAETLTHLAAKGVPLAVCTNKAEGISRDVIAALGLEGTFAAVIGGDSGYGRKPDPGPLLEACRVMDAEADKVLMVGDTVMDVGAARGAGTQVTVVSYGYSQTPVQHLGADLVIETFGELSAIVTGP